MSKRITKKMLTPFEASRPSGAVLMVNLFDPQIPTTRLFLEAVTSHRLPYLVIGNKADLVSQAEISRIEAELGVELIPVSLAKHGNTAALPGLLRETFSPGSRIAVLGVFNTGKTSLIAHLTGLPLKISNMPGTTLSFEEYAWGDYTLIDSVGQLIDVNRPLMVGYDFAGLETPTEMVEHALRQEAEAILSSVDTARPGLLKALTALRHCLDNGGKLVATGAGASGLVAEEMAGQFFETGVMCVPVTNALGQGLPVSFAKGIAEEEGGLARFIAAQVNMGDVLIAISASGGTGFVYEALRLSRDKGAVTIAITENKDTPMGVYADIVIQSNAKPEGPSSTRIQTTHLAIGHALVCTLAAVRGLSGEESIRHMLTEHIATKKMGIK
jgi:D-arabinose 5-phosphate isomerase GutQ/GTP-binding protein EngB required for normal cell division